MTTNTNVNDHKKEALNDPRVRRRYEALTPKYIRIVRKLTKRGK